MRYCLLTLGQASVAEDGGAPIDFPVGKPFGILAYLALSSDPVPRDELAALFWPEADPSRARHSLRQALSFLRKQLGDDVFVEDDPVAVAPSVVAADVELLEEALEAGDVGAVLELYAGPFLETFQLPASPALDHWAETQRRILEERVAGFLREAANGTESPERAVALLHRVVGIEPHRVKHRVALVDRLLHQGDLEAATAALAEARQSDIEDAEALAEMEERIRAVREGRRIDRSDREEITPEFVGRTSELAALTAAWRQSVRGRRQIAVISGPTGIGKTRLAEELAVVAGTTGRAVRVKASPVERRLDWGVTAELARSLYRLPGAAGVGGGADHVLRSLVPTLGGASEPAANGTPRAVAVSDALADLVSAVAYETPLLIVLDDMQWVDRASLALLLRLARQIRDEPVMIVFTFRSEELGARQHTAITALVDEEGAARVRLHTLSRSELEELLTLGLREPPARVERLAGRLHDVTKGHPLFLVELLRSLQDDGVLTVDADGWRLRDSDPVELELPVSVRLVIHKRLEQLSDDARTVGSELAALPPSSGLERVRARTGLSDAAFTGALNELLERAVVSWDSAGRVEFTHDQLREAMAERAPQRGRWRWLAAAVVLLAVAGFGAAALSVGGSEPRWGGGMILAILGDTLGAVSPGDDEGEWVSRPDAFWAPEEVQTFRLQPEVLTDGRLIWHGSIASTLEAPEGVVHWSPDSITVRHWPGDDNVRDVSPNGTNLLWVTQRQGEGQYAKELRITRVGADTSRLLTGPAGMLDALWSRDGTRIAVQLTLERDSVLVLTPRGEQLWGREYYQAIIEDWCGPDRLMLVVRHEPTSGRHRLLIDLASTTEAVLDTAAIPGAQCSPDGTAFANRIVEAGVPHATVTEIETGRRHPLPEELASSVQLYWLPDSASPVPEALVAAADTLRLSRGSMTRLQSRIRMTGGRLRAATARWRSLSPSTASVLADTIVAANRPGATRLVGEYAGWLTDTVVVEVVEGDGTSLILADDFRTLDTRRWYEIGYPESGTTRVDGRPVLELRGDGRYSDGLISRTASKASAGFTVEMEVQTPQTQPDYQGFGVWIQHAAPPEDSTAYDHHAAWLRGDQVGFTLPAFQLEKWDPDLVRLASNVGTESVGRLPEGTDLATWTHVAIQVQTDGLATLWIDREQVTALRVPTTLLRDPLRVGIFGRVVGTHAYVRNFAWWAEPRYR